MSAVLLIRHAQSTWNATGRWQGQADPPLSETGRALAERAAEELGTGPQFDLVVTSDLERARHTGELLSRPFASEYGPVGAPVLVEEPSLREFHVGHWSGLTRSEIEERWPSELALFDTGRLAGPPGGESRDQFDLRVRHAAARVAGIIGKHGGGRTLVVTHGGVIRSLARSAGLPEAHIDNLAGYRGTAGTEGISLHHPVSLLQRADRLPGSTSVSSVGSSRSGGLTGPNRPAEL